MIAASGSLLELCRSLANFISFPRQSRLDRNPAGLQARNERGGASMDTDKVHVFARSLLSTHGDKAELEAAQKVIECERHGDQAQAYDWRRIQIAIKEMRGPHAS
jgi:hypothetical protein